MRGQCRERGTALIETVIIGFAIVGVALPLLVAVVGLSSARSAVVAEATDVAAWVARHGAVPREPEGFDISVQEEGNVVRAIVTTDVDLIGIGGIDVTVTVSGSATAVISPYRSGR